MGERATGKEVTPSRFGKVGFKEDHVRRPIRRINLMRWEPKIEDVLSWLSTSGNPTPGNPGANTGGSGPNK